MARRRATLNRPACGQRLPRPSVRSTPDPPGHGAYPPRDSDRFRPQSRPPGLPFSITARRRRTGCSPARGTTKRCGKRPPCRRPALATGFRRGRFHWDPSQGFTSHEANGRAAVERGDLEQASPGRSAPHAASERQIAAPLPRGGLPWSRAVFGNANGVAVSDTGGRSGSRRGPAHIRVPPGPWR